MGERCPCPGLPGFLREVSAGEPKGDVSLPPPLFFAEMSSFSPPFPPRGPRIVWRVKTRSGGRVSRFPAPTFGSTSIFARRVRGFDESNNAGMRAYRNQRRAVLSGECERTGTERELQPRRGKRKGRQPNRMKNRATSKSIDHRRLNTPCNIYLLRCIPVFACWPQSPQPPPKLLDCQATRAAVHSGMMGSLATFSRPSEFRRTAAW